MKTLLWIIVFAAAIYGGAILWKKTDSQHPAKKWLADKTLSVEITLAGGAEKKLEALRTELSKKRNRLRQMENNPDAPPKATPMTPKNAFKEMLKPADPHEQLKQEIRELEQKTWAVNAHQRKKHSTSN